MGKSWGAAKLLAGFTVVAGVGGCAEVPASGGLQGSAEPASDAPQKSAASDRSSSNLLRLAKDIEARGSVATALPLYERAAAAGDAGPAAYVLLADAYLKLNRAQEGADTYRKALAKAPDNAEAQLGLGGALLRLGQLEDGREMLEKAAPLVNTPQAYDKLGVAHMLSGQPGEALASFEHAHRMDGHDPDIATNLALATALLRDDAKAVSLAEQTLSYAGLKPYHRRNLILVLAISGETGKVEAAAAGSVEPAEVRSLIDRANRIRLLPTPKDRALALGTVRLAVTAR